EKALETPFGAGGFVAVFAEMLLHALVYLPAGGASFHRAQASLLSLLHGLVGFSNRFRGASADHGARDVTVVTGLLGTRKNIEHDRFVRPQRALADLVRVTTLNPARHDCVRNLPARLDDGGVDDRPQPFRGERGVAVDQSAVARDA